MTTSTTALVAPTIVAPMRLALGYAEGLLKDIPADRFATSPHPTMNHPAFVIGHLSIYPDRILEIIGRAELAAPRANYQELFKAGAPCLQDPSKYPSKDEIVSYYFDRYRAVGDALEETPDEVLLKPNPMEGRLREMFPTVALAANFMLNSHNMMHLGQVSAWRRAVGLPSVM